MHVSKVLFFIAFLLIASTTAQENPICAKCDSTFACLKTVTDVKAYKTCACPSPEIIELSNTCADQGNLSSQTCATSQSVVTLYNLKFTADLVGSTLKSMCTADSYNNIQTSYLVNWGKHSMSNSAINPAVTAISTSSQNNEIDCQKCSNQFNCINFINSGGSSLSQFTNFTEVYKNCLCFNDTNQTLNKTLIKESEKCSKLANCSTFNATSLLQISQAQPLKLVCENAIIPAFVFSILPNINNVKVIKTATTTYTSDTTFSPATEKPNIEHSDSTTILSPVFTVIVTFSVASTILLLILNILRSIVKKKSLQFDTSTSTFQDPLAFAIEESARISNLQQYPIPPPSYRESILECPPPPSLTETPTSNSTVSTNVIEASPKLSSEYVGCSVHRQVCPVSCLKPNNAVVPINIGTSNA